MKTIYIVRHGESEGNIGNVRQSPESNLTQVGIEQSKNIARFFDNIKIDHFISSPFNRAKQTADIIKDFIKVDYIEKDFLRERRRPSEQIGKIKKSPESLESVRMYQEAFVRGEKYKDGEDFNELMGRVKESFDYLDRLDTENILVVTHGTFLRAFLSFIVLGGLVTPNSCFSFIKNIKVMNGTVSVFVVKDASWKVTSLCLK